MTLSEERRSLALSTKGFMPENEGDALWVAAMEAVSAVPNLAMLELGSYCGRSTVWLGDVAQQSGTVLYALDHHRGSEENQFGWEHHDAEVVDERVGKMDTLPFFRATIHDADLEDAVVGLIGRGPQIAPSWATPLCFLFIDGGHGEEPARRDYEQWTPHVAVGGTLAIHDVFPDPADGGRPPYEQIYLPAIRSGQFVDRAAVGSLHVLTRVAK
ncbi:MAG: class I SAM-dependent methyltransferase [Ilumatobacter sp.]|nr:class I SAM-dependent methyltransferase [Ilumatobacter sp.]MDG2439334.1 class I SAM-dependent methyltransferase [Ilumatobacter sp.]